MTLPPGDDLSATCMQNNSTGDCSWQTNCIVDQCFNQCDNNTRPTTCPSPYALRTVDQSKGVIADCIMREGQCNWVPMNCYPPECRVTLQNSALFCGTAQLNCSLRCNVNPAEICVQQSDGSCGWNYPCPAAGACEVYSNMTAFTSLNSSHVPLCGTVDLPTCTSGQTFSGNAACIQGADGCQWVNNCEDEGPQPLCFFRKNTGLGLLCGSELIPSLCSDGSRFVPSYCTNTSDGKCIARGYCDRQSIVQINVNIIVNVNNTNNTNNVNTTNSTTNVTTPAVGGTTPAPSSTNTSQNLLCSGIDRPKCESTLEPILQSQCICTDDANGNRKCAWSALICRVQNACDQCNLNPCQESQQFSSGCCTQNSNNNANANASAGANGANVQTNTSGQCNWTQLSCTDKTTTCDCSNLPPTQCPCGTKRDNSESPVCIGESDGSCMLQSQCQNDTCGGIGTTLCQCDFTNCVFVSFGKSNATASGQSNNSLTVSTTGWEGCFSASSDSLRILANFPDAIITSQNSTDLCDQNNTQQNCDQNCLLAGLIRKQISDNSKISMANTRLTELQSDLRNSIDNQTGYMLGRDFRLTLLAVGIPPLRQDNSLDLNMIVYFQQMGNVQKPTQEHLRVYYQTFLGFISNLGNFTDANNWQYNWNTLNNYTSNLSSAQPQNQNQNQNQNNVQMNGQPGNDQNNVQMTQGPSASDDNTYILSINVPSQTVQSAFTQSRRDGGGSVSWGGNNDNSAQSAHAPFMLLVSFVMAFLLSIL